MVLASSFVALPYATLAAVSDVATPFPWTAALILLVALTAVGFTSPMTDSAPWSTPISPSRKCSSQEQLDGGIFSATTRPICARVNHVGA